MSIHPSLSSSEKDKKPRSILKRTERLRVMMEKGQWKEGDNVYGLPKIKTIRIKIKKEKVAEKVEAAVTEGAAESGITSETKKEPTTPRGPAVKGQNK